MNDVAMMLWEHGGEELVDEFCICDELRVVVREDVKQGLDISIPGDSPIRIGSDSLSRSAGTNDEFEGSNLLSFLVISSHSIDSRKDMVEIDDLTEDDVGPFSIRELGALS